MSATSKAFRGALVLATHVLMAASWAQAQNYPSRPVRLINPNAAGGVSDRMARAIAKAMEPSFGQPLVIDNKPGAASVVGVSEVLRSKPDGYVVGQTCLASVLTLPLTSDKPPFNFQEDATIVGMMGGLDTMIVTRSDNPVSTIEGLIADAKAKPGQVTIGMVQSVANVIPIVYMGKQAGVELNVVNYRGEGAVLNDLLGGTIQYGVHATGSALPHLQAGKLKAIQVLAQNRNPALPNVPSFADTKVAGFPPNSFCVMFVPKGTPEIVVQTLNRSLNEAAKDKELTAQWVREGLVPYIGGTPAEASQFVKEVAARWATVAKEIDFSKYR